ncbi:MAG TPA: ABC transporter permease [Candidatus Dormibacteraeota bacterium]|nr:ABC transporter permease [Candidatus Dormibacteraeota bacterium]
MSVAQETPVKADTSLKPVPPPKNGRWSGYTHLLMARMLELKREPEVVFWVFIFPLLLALGLGIAFRNKPGNAASVAIVQAPGSPVLQAALANAPQHDQFKIQVLNEDDARQGFRLGKFDLVIEPGADRTIQYRYDPARPESVLAKAEVNDTLQAAAGRRDSVPINPLPSSEPGSRYIDFLIPGLLGMNLMNSGMWGIGFALVDMRQRKLLKRFVGTPMRRGDFLLALASSRLILMIIEVGLLLVFGVLFFHMRVLGSIGSIALIAGLGSLTFGGVGLLTASRAQKIESVSGLINLVMMPMWIFSGVFFSYERFPAVIQPLIKALPLTALNDALRASILEGTPLTHQWTRLLIMILWGGISFALALKWFRWT